ncbi:hypothetical protein SCP_0203260 [Sparassis crispa]|uniref:Uncharacterized protein n=1 Tax=Sparassis crispa TaxID=139825 RepID=A0A401GAF6_9APHY|nr:hypothetical protein SCP_0203260 [Sparassis crispa]GBE79129.1 hypothetical protein SCP_0203260 [Sparassis crispa]
MPKPTLIQSLLGRPSQTYSFPQQKEYHSSKHELIRIATTRTECHEAPGASLLPGLPPTSSVSPSVLSEHVSAQVVPNSDVHSPPRTFQGSTRSVHFQKERTTDSDLLPKRSLIRQIASFHTAPPAQHGHTSYLNPLQYFRTDRHQVDFTRTAELALDGDAAEDDMFYTPRSSTYSSPRASRSSTLLLLDSHALANALLPLHSAAAPPELDTTVATPVSRTPSDSSLSSHASSSTDHDEAGSSFSSSCATTSTRITTPLSSDHGALKPGEDVVETVAISTSPQRSPSPHRSAPSPSPINQPAQQPEEAVQSTTTTASQTVSLVSDSPARSESPVRLRPLSISSLPSCNNMEGDAMATRRRSQVEARMTMYTDEDWANEVKMSTAKMTSTNTSSPRRMSRPLHPDLLPPIPTGSPTGTSHFLEPPTTFPQATPRPGARSRSKADRSSRHSHRQSRGRMSALWEEDESEYSTAPSSCEPSRAPTPVHFTESLSSLTPSSTAPSSPGPLHPLFLSNTNPMDKYMLSDEQSQLDESPDAMLQDYARLRGQLRSRPSSPVRSPLVPSESSTMSSSLPTYSIPTPFPGSVSNSPPTGYTSLTLPRANYANETGKAMRDGKVDLVRAGVAQSSMATIEVVRGASLAVRSRPGNRRGFSLTLSFGLKGKKPERRRSVNRKESMTPAHLRSTLPLPVAFTSHLPPPSFCPPSHVLVQVFAVALDGLDSLLVQEKIDDGSGGASAGSLRKGRAGFIPGRSFVGRAMECGFEVKDEVCKRGEWVVGLLDVRKCGALAEFILVERHRVFRSPQPCARPITLFPPRRRKHTRSMSLPSQQHPTFTPSPLVPPAPLSLEELALLPLIGLSAHRAVRSFADVLSTPRTRDLESRPRMLILQGHDGPGCLALQLLARKGVRVSVQVPESAVCDILESSTEGTSQDESRIERVETRIRDWGAEEVCVGTPVEVLQRFADECRSFDAVLDTVGGVAIWEAAQRMLLLSPSAATARHASKSSPAFSVLQAHPDAPEKTSKFSPSQAQFTTLVGDTPNRAIPKAQDNLKSGFRSLRRAITTSSQGKTAPIKVLNDGKKSVKRTVGYTWVSVAADVDFEGEDVRDTLAAVVAMVEEGVMRPWAGLGDPEDQDTKVLPLERAPEVFRRDAAGPLGVLKDGGTCVVKISD